MIYIISNYDEKRQYLPILEFERDCQVYARSARVRKIARGYFDSYMECMLGGDNLEDLW